MTLEELNWLLQTIKDVANAERFVLAQNERGRISFQVMADTARKRGINLSTKHFLARAARHLSDYATTEVPIAIA